jgi:decaprenyl-phosphate phosphoribosyltransferase
MDSSASTDATRQTTPDTVILEPAAPPRMGLAAGLVRTARPRQWAKNVLIFAAPFAAGIIGHEGVWWRLAVTFVAFCALSSGGYFFNDALDVDRDRSHPRKRLRPIAAGTVPLPVAYVTGTLLFAFGFALSIWMGSEVAAVAAAYVALTVGYSYWLKHEPVVEMVLLALAFVLRAAAGGEAVGVSLSPWFTVVVSFGALLVVAGKRYAEQTAHDVASTQTRQVLERYPDGFLRFVWAMAATITVTGYCLWALLPAKGPHIPAPWPAISVIPFVVGILRYAMLLEAGSGEAPEDLFLRDRILQLSGVIWVAIYAIGLYAR